MKLLSALAIATSAFSLSACLPDLTESEFATPTDSGDFAMSFDESVAIVTEDGSGNGYAYEIGVSEGDFFGVAYPVVTVLTGILPTTSVSELPSSGQATFSGAYEAVLIDLTQVSDDMTYEDIEAAFYNTGTIDLVADFGAGTLTGSSGDLTVNGTFDSELLGGTVNYDGLSGDLTGLIGGNRAVGAFQGDDLDEVLVGGFIVN